MNETAPAADQKSGQFLTAPLIIILLTVFIDLVGFGMVIPILPFFAETPPFNANPLEIGFVVSIYSWMQFFFSPVLGRLSDSYGRRPVLFLSLLGSVAGYLVIGLANTLFLVFLGRIISGITGGNIATAQAYIADVTTRENRAKAMGLSGAAFGLGFILGPAIAGILSKYGMQVPFYFAAFLSFLSAAGVYFLLPESITAGHRERAAAAAGRLAHFVEALREKDFRLVNLVYFLLITSFSIMTYAFVLYTAFRFGYNAEQNGYLFAFVGFIAIVGQGVLFGRLVGRFGETVLAAFGCVLMMISLFIIPIIGPMFGGLAALLFACVLLSFGNALASPALTSLVSKIAHEHSQGSSLGIMHSLASLARAIGPTIGGFLLNSSLNTVDEHTLYRTFWTASGIMFAAFLLAVYAVKVINTERHLAETR